MSSEIPNIDADLSNDFVMFTRKKKQKNTQKSKVSEIENIFHIVHNIGDPIVYVDNRITDDVKKTEFWPGKVTTITNSHIIMVIPSYEVPVNPDTKIQEGIECKMINEKMHVRMSLNKDTLKIIVPLIPVIHLLNHMDADDLYDLADYAWAIICKYELFMNEDVCKYGNKCKNKKAGHLAYSRHNIDIIKK
jgi:hypothetical protein